MSSERIVASLIARTASGALRSNSATQRSTVLRATTTTNDLWLTPETVLGLVGGWPEWATAPSSLSCYVQPYLRDEGLRLVVNVVSGGHGRGWSRWARLRALAGDDAGREQPPAGPDPDGPVVAELSGVYGASVNLRVPAAPFEIDYPYTTSSRPAAERIAFGDLRVRSSRTGIPELVRAADGRAVEPVHLGLMADPLLPPAARFMLAAFGRSFFLHPGFPLFDLPEQPTDVEAVRRTPRLGLGTLTIQRARWHAAASAVPIRVPDESHESHLLRLAAWLAAAGIPRRCYVRFAADGSGWQDQLLTKSRKPMFVDFAAELFVSAFDHSVKQCQGRISFEEELPAAGGVLWPDAARSRVTEVILEVAEER